MHVFFFSDNTTTDTNECHSKTWVSMEVCGWDRISREGGQISPHVHTSHSLRICGPFDPVYQLKQALAPVSIPVVRRPSASKVNTKLVRLLQT